MVLTNRFALLALFAALCSFTTAAEAAQTVVAVTGGQVQGTLSSYDPKVLMFRGIPYAADTSGKNRFRAPQPLQSWSGIRAATAAAAVCPSLGALPPPFAPEAFDDDDILPMSEDCLNLNVWTPATDGGRRPVMVFIHGGGFAANAGGFRRSDGTRLAGRQDVVVVTIEYRLNIFGFLNLSGIDPDYAKDANPGLQDILAAVRWVHDNAAAFGGDAGDVTIFGQSAGADAVAFLLTSQAAHGLFQKAIIESGNLTPFPGPEQTADQARASLGILGIGNDLAGLDQLPWDKVMDGFTGNGPWFDGKIVTGQPLAAESLAISADVPVMIGWTQTENTFFEGPQVIDDEPALAAAVSKLVGSDATASKLIEAYRAEYPDINANTLYFRLSGDRQYGGLALKLAAQRAPKGARPPLSTSSTGRPKCATLCRRTPSNSPTLSTIWSSRSASAVP